MVQEYTFIACFVTFPFGEVVFHAVPVEYSHRTQLVVEDKEKSATVFPLRL